MTVLLALALPPLALAIVLARGEPARTVGCLGAMGVGCFIACASLVGAIRHRA